MSAADQRANGFQTERLVLRPFTAGDADVVHALLDLDPDNPGMSRVAVPATNTSA